MAERRGFSPGAGKLQESAPRWTSGRECWVFRAEAPDQLCGHHPKLIAQALDPSESLRYLLYSPIFDAREGPFRVGGAPCSHAVGITASSLFVSRDPHTAAARQTITRIDLDDVAFVEIGCALALGWFVVRYTEGRGARSCPVLFRSQGLDHFREIVRAYRRLGRPGRGQGGGRLGWPAVWEGVPGYVRSEVEPLLEEAERPLAVLHTPERWTTAKRWWRERTVCACASGLLVVTSHGLLWAASEPRPRPDGFSFGVDVTVVRPERLREATVASRASLGVLRLKLGDGDAPHAIEVPFDLGDVASAEEIVRLARMWQGPA